jgi:hypothetical protein
MGSDVSSPDRPVYNDHAGAYLCPFIMGRINTRIVHLSNSLLPGGGYGSDFKYHEAHPVRNLVLAWVMVLALRLLGAAISGPLFSVLKRWGPLWHQHVV